MKYGLIEEDKIENQRELARMRALADKSSFKLAVYEGKTNDLDLHLEWYCPHCLTKLELSKPSKNSSGHEVLFCTSHPERCEYDFSNKHHRILTNTWWGKGFTYPLNPLELHLTLIKREEAKVISHQNNIKHYQQKLVESEENLKVLKALTSQIENKLFN